MRAALRQAVGMSEPAQLAGESLPLNFQECLESVVIPLVGGDQLWWEHLYHENWQTLPQGLPLALRDMCVEEQGEGRDTCY